MRNSLKAFLFCIVLPAIGLAAVGLFLLSVGVDNLKKVGVEVLQSTAQQTAQHIRQQVQAEVDETFAEIGRLTVTNRAALAGIAAARPLVKDVRRRPRGRDGFLWRDGFAVQLDREAITNALPAWLSASWDGESEEGQSETAMTAVVRSKDGRILCQLPGFRRNLFTVGAPLAPEIPGVRVCVGWRDAEFREGRIRSRIYLIGIVVILLLVTSLFGGAWMLVRSAHEARLEARRQLDFTAGVSHEFKTPLTAILLAAEFAESRVTDPAAKQALRDVAEETSKLSHLVSDVLDTARFSDDRRLPVDPTDVGDGVMALANRPALDHLLANLRENAAKYAPGSPPEERVRTEGDRVRIDVMDRGPGLTDEELRHVFENYWRGDRSVTRKTGGCGLGLPIARCLARMQGGDLTVARRAGGGLVFTIDLKKAEVTNG